MLFRIRLIVIRRSCSCVTYPDHEPDSEARCIISSRSSSTPYTPTEHLCWSHKVGATRRRVGNITCGPLGSVNTRLTQRLYRFYQVSRRLSFDAQKEMGHVTTIEYVPIICNACPSGWKGCTLRVMPPLCENPNALNNSGNRTLMNGWKIGILNRFHLGKRFQPDAHVFLRGL